MAATNIHTVLVIDDNDVSRGLLRHIIASNSRYRVVGQTGSGELGLRMIEKLRPRIVCLDVIMDDTDGLTVLKSIKARWPETAVLMVTGCKDEQTVRGAMQHGADGYILKPFVPATLLQAVAGAIRKTTSLATPALTT